MHTGGDGADRVRLYLARAKNELDLADAVFRISGSNRLKEELKLDGNATFFSNAIGIAYYCIFYSAKAFLLSEGVLTGPPEEHRQTLREFGKLVESGKIDTELLEIYKSIAVRVDELLGIFALEKSKRKRFTYERLAQANIAPARESVQNAEKFLKNIVLLIK